MALTLTQIDQALKGRGVDLGTQQDAVVATIASLNDTPETLVDLSILLDRIDGIIRENPSNITAELTAEFGDAGNNLALYGERRNAALLAEETGIEIDINGGTEPEPEPASGLTTQKEEMLTRLGIDDPSELAPSTIERLDRVANLENAELNLDRFMREMMREVELTGDDVADRTALMEYARETNRDFLPAAADIIIVSGRNDPSHPDFPGPAVEEEVGPTSGLSERTIEMLAGLGVEDPSKLSASSIARLERVSNVDNAEFNIDRFMRQMIREVELTGDPDKDRVTLNAYVSETNRDFLSVAADVLIVSGRNDPSVGPELNLPSSPYGVEPEELSPETVRWIDGEINKLGTINTAVARGQGFLQEALRNGVEFTGDREKDAEIMADYIRATKPVNSGIALIADQTADIFTNSDVYDKFVEDRNSRDESGRKLTGLHPEEYRQAPDKGGNPLFSIGGAALGGLIGLFLPIGGIPGMILAAALAVGGFFLGDMLGDSLAGPGDDSKVPNAPNAQDLKERRIDPRERTKMLSWEPQEAGLETANERIVAAKEKAEAEGKDFNINEFVLSEIERVEARLTPDPESAANPSAPALRQEVEQLRTLIYASSADLSPGVVTTIGEEYPNYLPALNVEAIGDRLTGVPENRREWLNPNLATVEQLADSSIFPVWSLATLNPDKITEIFTNEEFGPQVRQRIAEEVEARSIPGDTPEEQLANFFAIRGNNPGATAITIAVENAGDPAKLEEQKITRDILDQALQAAGIEKGIDIDGDNAPDRLTLSDVDASDRDDIMKVVNDLRASGQLEGDIDEQVEALSEALLASGNLERLYDRKDSTITTQQYSSELER